VIVQSHRGGAAFIVDELLIVNTETWGYRYAYFDTPKISQPIATKKYKNLGCCRLILLLVNTNDVEFVFKFFVQATK